jgi:signal transduction histidine kinase
MRDMSARQPFAAGLVVGLSGALVLAGWALDITAAKSLLPGWRPMVPSSAWTFICLGAALIAGSRGSSALRAIAVPLLAIAGAVMPAATLIEYVSSTRLGVEHWLGFSFAGDQAVAGRLSPLAAICFTVLCAATALLPFRSRAVTRFIRLASAATLMTAWLGVLAVSFDTNRLNDLPRFPGMAALTLVMMAAASAGTLALSMRHARVHEFDVGPRRPVLILVAGFLMPLALGWIQVIVERNGWISIQLVTALVAFGFALVVAWIVWRYTSRLAMLQRDRERALATLEERVSERTHALAASNDELRKREDLLRDADRRKDEFLATLAHELRNPLAPIRNAAGVLRHGGATAGEQHEAVLIIERQVAQMARLIDDLLDVSRITAGKLPMRKELVALADVINMAVATSRPHLDQAQHRLTVSLPPAPIFIEADAARLSQVFANLLHNACKYTEPGGEIALAAAAPTAGEVEVAVRDNGIGIPAAFLPRLFEKFSQVAPALDRSQGGLGLGLSLVHGIVSLHGGCVTARSAGAARGSEFIVSLPVVQAPEMATPETPPPPARVVVSRRMLVVDDNEDSAESMAVLLRIEGHLVQTAHDGEAALALAERFRPDIVLLDLGMPNLNGYEVCSRIRQAAWGREMLVIAQTGWGQEQDRRRTKDAGFDGHLTKPIDPAALAGMLDGLSARNPR